MPFRYKDRNSTQTGFKRKKETHDLTHQEAGSTGWMEGVGAVNQWLISVIGHHGSPSQGWFSPCCKIDRSHSSWAAFSTPAPGSGPRPPLDWEPSPSSEYAVFPTGPTVLPEGARPLCPGSRRRIPEPQALGWGPRQTQEAADSRSGWSRAAPVAGRGRAHAGRGPKWKRDLDSVYKYRQRRTEQARGCSRDEVREGGSEMGLEYANWHV